MQYDWKKIIEDQKESTLSVKEYCKQNNICVSSFYKSKKRLEDVVLCQEKVPDEMDCQH